MYCRLVVTARLVGISSRSVEYSESLLPVVVGPCTCHTLLVQRVSVALESLGLEFEQHGSVPVFPSGCS